MTTSILENEKISSDFSGRNTKFILVALSLSMLLASLGTSIANVALPALAGAFAAPFQQVQWIVLAYLLSITTLIVGVGRLGDIFGRRKLLLIGLAVFSASSLLCGMAPTLWWLIAARAAQGLGAAVMMALTMAFVSETVPKERTGSAMGLLGTTSAIGTALGPSLGGILIAWLGWRAIFLVGVPLGLLAFGLAYRFLPVARSAAGQDRMRFDFLGTLLLACALGAYALAMTLGQGHFGMLNIGLLAAAAVGAGLFVLVELRAPSPLVRLSAFRDAEFSAGLIGNALVSTVMMATLVVGPFYLSHALGLDEASTGFVLSVGPVISAVFGVVAGRIVDRFGASAVVMVGLAEMATGALALATLPVQFGVSGYIAAIAVLTPGYQLFQAANNTAVMMNVLPTRRGVMSGMLNLARNLGLMTGASAMGAIFAFAAGPAEIATVAPQAVTIGMQTTFAAAAALIVVAIAIIVFSRIFAKRASSGRGAP